MMYVKDWAVMLMHCLCDRIKRGTARWPGPFFGLLLGIKGTAFHP